jgi:hypothetical protein
MKELTRYAVLALIVVSFSLFAGCAQQAQMAKATPAEQEIVSTEGYYENKTLGFSFEYPARLFSEETELKADDVVFAREGAQRIPALALIVADIQSGASLENVSALIEENNKKALPDSTGHEIEETKMIKLENGVDANYTLMKWRFQGMIPIVSAYVSVYKDDKLIQVAVSSVPGQPPVEILAKWAKSLKVTL